MPTETLKEFERCRRIAEQYYAYHSIHKYTDEPFTALTPDTVFNISRALLAQLLRGDGHEHAPLRQASDVVVG